VLYPSELRGRPDSEKVTPMRLAGKEDGRIGRDAISPGVALLYKSLVGLRYFVECQAAVSRAAQETSHGG
jgi:hypothetical protein